MGDVSDQAASLLTDIQTAGGQYQQVAEKLNTEVFKDTTIANLSTALANLKKPARPSEKPPRRLTEW